MFSSFPLDIAFLALISIVPISLWFLFFHYKYKQPLRHVILSFVAGMMSVIPIKLYEKYWDISILYFENINLFQSLSKVASIPSLDTFLAFVTLSGVVALGLYVFTGLMMFCLEVFSGDNTVQVYNHKVRKILESPLLFVWVGVVSGVAAYFLSLSVSEKVWIFVIVGMLEEYIKHLVLRFSSEETIKRIRDAISFAVIVALGFAYIENIMYFHNYLQEGATSGNFWILFALRSLISVTAHVCFSGILAYFYGLAFFSKEIYQYDLSHNKGSVAYLLHKILHLKGDVLFHEQKLMEGMLLAMILHAIFNLSLEFGHVTLMLTLIVGMFMTILYMYHKARFITEVKICPQRASACEWIPPKPRSVT